MKLGTTGAISGAVTGAVGGAIGSPIRQIGNGIVFGDPFDVKSWGIETLTGGLVGGAIGGGFALFKGQNFWWGNTPRSFSFNIRWNERQILERATEQEIKVMKELGVDPSFKEIPGVAAKPQIQTSGKGLQLHHFASNKNAKFSPDLEKIAAKYGLDLDGDWNKMMLPHAGRHPDLYHEFVLDGMKRASQQAGSSTQEFLKLFHQYVKMPVIQNPDILYLKGWR